MPHWTSRASVVARTIDPQTRFNLANLWWCDVSSLAVSVLYGNQVDTHRHVDSSRVELKQFFGKKENKQKRGFAMTLSIGRLMDGERNPLQVEFGMHCFLGVAMLSPQYGKNTCLAWNRMQQHASSREMHKAAAMNDRTLQQVHRDTKSSQPTT
eukprot:GILJ01007832.1.p1 GENE.GILJ01007832.1~~GILJ01007832.1.p1  ORF type:complete len:154 (-),score=8.00 GILJ01007832.1:735-1196(-)